MVDENDLGILAAYGQQLVHREGGGAEDGPEGDGVDALSPQLTQGGQRDAEGSCEPPGADREDIVAPDARVGDALAEPPSADGVEEPLSEEEEDSSGITGPSGSTGRGLET